MVVKRPKTRFYTKGRLETNFNTRTEHYWLELLYGFMIFLCK